MLNCSVFPPQLWKIYLPPFAFDPAWTSWTLQVLKSCWLYFVFLLLIAAAYLHFTQKCLRHKIHFKVKVNKNGRFQAAFAIMWCEGQWRFLLEGVMINVNKLRNCQIAVVSFFFQVRDCFDHLFPPWVEYFFSMSSFQVFAANLEMRMLIQL